MLISSFYIFSSFSLFRFSAIIFHHSKKKCGWLCPSPPFRILPTQKLLLLIIIPWVKGTRVSCAAKFAVLHACLSDSESCFRRSHLPELDPASLETRKTSPAAFLQARRVAEMCCLLHFPGNPRIGERHFTGPKRERERHTHTHCGKYGISFRLKRSVSLWSIVSQRPKRYRAIVNRELTDFNEF